MKITEREFGILEDNVIYQYVLENDNGMRLACLNYGCIITDIFAKDRYGKFENVLLGFDNIEDYLHKSPYFGAIIGRVAGRIADGHFELNGETYRLDVNEGNNHLHGGKSGFDKKIWHAKTWKTEDKVGVDFTYTSTDGEEGYPGEVQITVRYYLTNDDEWVQICKAKTNKETLLNMTNHSYFNLTGNLKETILNHQLTLKSEKYLPLREDFIPTGEMIDVTNTVFDFRNGKVLKDGIKTTDKQINIVGNGYDHPFALTDNFNEEIQLYEPVSGRKLVIETNQPCVVVYTGNQLTNHFLIRNRQVEQYLGICLETQQFPDAIHHPHFPSIILKPEEEYVSETKYKFSIN
ncbi:aldose epimerase family protein [Bacillus kwashiorkori]|uniref:aldose epimerase family protein n=1 Tax=Bacillus kwashiorkori TaxID=1522318 RepID=UPI0007821178|nr:aldose epimerase family protein [Bacillus kwashiorkori]